MTFYLALLAVNFACFVPLYALNFRERPNPFEFITSGRNRDKVRILYAKQGLTDPFRINFDYTLVLLLAAAGGYADRPLIWFATLLLAFGVVEILYTAIFHSVFKRPPSILGDVSLAKTGLEIAQVHAYWIVPAALALLAGIIWAAHGATSVLFDLMPRSPRVQLPAAAAITLPCFYHWKRFSYREFVYRTVYSPLLHLYKNLECSHRFKALTEQPPEYFERHNEFTDLVLGDAPNVVVICIESYGSVVYRDERYHAAVAGVLDDYEAKLELAGLKVASSFSAAPLFAGGSWLSYVSFTYGTRVDDVRLYDFLFTHAPSFGAYESLFHVLKRNRYESIVLCPLAGVDARSVDWSTIDRCFQSDWNIDFRSLDYRGPGMSYVGLGQIFAPPDQYALNLAYERILQRRSPPFSLFFCTLNSHFPWSAATQVVPDWRELNRAQAGRGPAKPRGRLEDRYGAAIRYQLEYILEFVVRHADDDLLVVLFGDHQPPFLTPESMGTHTPVHVLGRSSALVDVFLEHGFLPAMDLHGRHVQPIKHEGFLSLFLKGMQAAYGSPAGPEIAYRENGAGLFEGAEADALA